jgi:Ski2 N-terminal region
MTAWMIYNTLNLVTGGIRTIPPGFERGLDFNETGDYIMSVLRRKQKP